MTRKPTSPSAGRRSRRAQSRTLDLVELERLASNPAALLKRVARSADRILDGVRKLPAPELTAQNVLDSFAGLRDVHHNRASAEAEALLKMLAMGQQQLSDGRTVTLEQAIAYAKRQRRTDPPRSPKFDEVEEAVPGRLTNEEFARVLAGGTPRNRSKPD